MIAAFAHVDITPQRSLPLQGYVNRTNSFHAVDDGLEADIIVLRDAANQAIVVAGIDCCIAGPRILEGLSVRTGIDRSRFVLVASHTHNAPALEPALPRLGAADDAWRAEVIERLARSIELQLGASGHRLQISYGEVTAPLNCNRRKRMFVLNYRRLIDERRIDFRKTVCIAANPAGYVDPTLRMLKLQDDMGIIRAVIWSFPAHPAFYPEKLHVSADFPGRVRRELRSLYGPECAVIYLPGFAGSAIPKMPALLPRSPEELIRFMLPFHPPLPKFNHDTFEAWSSELADAARRCAGAMCAPTSVDAAVIKAAVINDVFLAGDGPAKSVIGLSAVHLVLGKMFGLIALSGEMVAEWSPILHSIIPRGHIHTSYLAGPPIYVPTDSVVAEGGYEAEGFLDAFGLSGRFTAGLDDRVRSGVANLVARAN